jgi:sugar phosphate isomerase/epimerase
MSLPPWSIGVFTSIDAGLGVHLEVARDLQIPSIQLHTPHAEGRTPAAAEQFLKKLDAYGIELTCVFGGFEGESYADIPTVEKTIGLVPVATRAARLKEMKEISDFTRLLGCNAVGLHIGVVPHDVHSQAYREIVEITRQLCDHAQHNEQNIHLETGQESATGLMQFIGDTQRSNLFINFDPANMILYGMGEPIPALRHVGSHVRSIHCKDATWSDQPGITWGAEVPLGKGQVDMRAYLSTLKEIGYLGPLTIEREIPQDRDRQKEEIQHAVELLTQLRKELIGNKVA